MLLKSPGFTFFVVVTLGLGIGLNTAIFSLVNAILFRPLPFEGAERIVALDRGDFGDFFSYLDYTEYRDRSEVFESLSAWSYAPISVGSGQTTELRFGQIVTGEYFQTLAVEAALGRVLTPEDDKVEGGHSVAVLSHPYWRRAYGGSSSAVGKVVPLNGHPFRIIGVAPEGFVGAFPAFTPDVWVPMMMQEQIMPDGAGRLHSRHGGWLRVIGRLKSGISIEQASMRIDGVAEHLVEIDPERYKDENAFLTHPSGIGMPPEARPMALGLSAVIMSMVGLVLLVACANVANLLLARSTARRGEIAIRLALGAGRVRIVRQLLTESGLLALLAGAVGLLLSGGGMSLAKVLMPELPYNMSLATDFSFDGRVFGYAVAISMLTGVVFGLAPALQVTKANVVPALKDDVGARGTGARRSRLRGALVVAQVAVSLVLLISAGLFVRSLRTATAIDPGFDHENVLAVSLAFALHDEGSDTKDAFFAPLLERVRAIPGVESASVDQCIPLGFTQSGSDYWVEGRPPRLDADGEEDPDSSFSSIVSEGGFKTLGISLLRGRDFNEFDVRDRPGVVIVNKALADRNWPGESVLGQQISLEGAEGPFLEIVGVASTVKYIFIGEQPRSFLYLPFSQNYDPNMNLLVRASGDPMALLPPVLSVIRDLNPDVTPADTRILSGWIGFALLPAKLAAMLFGLFGVVAILIASVGLYGVMSYTVGRRTREIGIRVALGAQQGDVLRLILRQGLVLTAVGLGVGLLASFGGTRVLSALLYDVSVVDPITFVGVSVLLLTVALLACYVPARRAARVNPIVALRYE